jgi:hypothetical protein
MPRYEFFSKACEKLFSRTLIAEEFQEGRIVCPSAAAKRSNSARPLSTQSIEKRAPDPH